MHIPPMNPHISFVVLLCVLTVLNSGCGAGDAEKTSYADLVVIYNAELATLDRLEKKKADLIANYEKQLQPNAEDALQAIGEALNSTDLSPDQPASETNPREPDDLDRAVEHAEKMQEATTQLLEAAAEKSQAAEGSLSTQYSEEFKAQLAALDKEIALQQARVDRARQARDAAEPK